MTLRWNQYHFLIALKRIKFKIKMISQENLQNLIDLIVLKEENEANSVQSK